MKIPIKTMWSPTEFLIYPFSLPTVPHWSPDPDYLWGPPSHCLSGIASSSLKIFRPVCEAGQSLWCNNVTGNFVLVHTFSLAGEADLQLQLFTASSLDGSVFKIIVRHPFNRRPCAPQNRYARFGYMTELLLPRESNPKLSATQTNTLSLHWKIHRGFNT